MTTLAFGYLACLGLLTAAIGASGETLRPLQRLWLLGVGIGAVALATAALIGGVAG